MLSKYYSRDHPLKVKVYPCHSQVWKWLVGIRDKAEESIHLEIGTAACDFWIDSWLPSGPIDKEHAIREKVNEYWHGESWDMNKLIQLAPEIRHEILLLHRFSGDKDVALWKLSKNGMFSFKTAFEEVRTPRESSTVYSFIWNSIIPKKTSFLVYSQAISSC
ncbi:hypothetical protein LIER_40492 [Lithospermum erythrorhizon]|uniref:Uncharacterized protein n=1 Tax=Lithospermum erythrorhizon TaxID=34254 RepID=A0AAV3QVN4_LITER